MYAIFKRELNAYFTTMQGYVFMAVFLTIAGLGFLLRCVFPGVASLSGVFYFIIDTMIILIPILTMRLMSEDKKNKTDQILATAPVPIAHIVLGKYFAACVLFVMTSLLTLIFPVIMAIFGTPVLVLEMISGYLGLWLLAMALIALGLFISSLTEHQFIAMLLTLISIAFLMIVVDALISAIENSGISGLLKWFSLLDRFITTFDSGLLSFSAILFYASFGALFLNLTALLTAKSR